jgi:RNA polymerase sigma-70 factor (ECF subfamily)
VDDALQDVFLVVHDKLPDFVPHAKLSTWIYAITYRVAQNYRRHNQKTNHTPLSGEELSLRESPESETAAAEAARFVREFCDSIPEEKRDVFVLCVLEERTSPEVAALLDVKLNTVYSRLRNVRAEFRERLLERRKKEVR